MQVKENSGFINLVSIQLVSPASGDKMSLSEAEDRYKVSIQLVSPASGDTAWELISFLDYWVFPFN